MNCTRLILSSHLSQKNYLSLPTTKIFSSTKRTKQNIFFAVIIFFLFGLVNVFGQAEFTAWGNLNGIRIDGQLIKFETGISLIGPTLGNVIMTGKEKQHPSYKREGGKQTVTTEISKFEFIENLEEPVVGIAKINIKAKAVADTTLIGAFLFFDLPSDDFSKAEIKLIDSAASTMAPLEIFPGMRKMPAVFRMRNLLVQALVKGFKVETATRKIEVLLDQPTEIIVQKGMPRFGNSNDRIYLGIITGHTKDGQTADKNFTIKASGQVDDSPVQITIDSKKPGRAFDGIGGNFRIQNERLDPVVIDYCLNNLNVRWARVEMPWRNWHQNEAVNPLEAARAGKLDESVRGAMQMAQKLHKRNLPIIVSAWSAPTWAISGEPNYRNENGIFGNPLNPKKMRSVIKSIGEYFVYLKEAYGVEADFFSFNESDLGINVRFTGQEHAEFIKALGAYFASKNLSTKLLLGDNSDATTIDFIEPALKDETTHKYIGAISFHAWRGCDNWTLENWADASRELNVPLIIAEGGTDAQAHSYSDVFQESWFAQDEVDIYVRSINTGNVKSILQWQLTSDYSLLTGDGIYDSKGPLKPTRRFWNLKQLGLTPTGSFILPLTCNKTEVSCAALGDVANGTYTVHIVNHGAARTVELKGLPENVKLLRSYVTDNKNGMDEGKKVNVANGKAKLSINADCFVTLVSAD